MSILRYNTFNYAYRRYGDTEAPAIVLIMGLALSSSFWPDLFIREIVSQGFQVITVDNRDSGESTHFSEVNPSTFDVVKAIVCSALHRPVHNAPYALEDMAFDIERVLDALKIRRAHILGMSMGGMIAQTMAMQCPNRVASLISLSSASGNFITGLGNPFVVSSLLFSKARDTADEATKLEYMRKYILRLACDTYPPTPAELEQTLEKLKVFPNERYAQRRQLMAIFASGDRREMLSQIRVPTLVIHGTCDPLLPLKAGRECANLIKGSKYIEIKGMGHIMTHALIPTLSSHVIQHCREHTA